MPGLNLTLPAVYSLVSLGLSVRLLRMWRRTRLLPELLFGLGFLLGGFLANAMFVLRTTLPLESLWLPVRLINLFGSSGAGVLAAIGAWYIFKPDRWWARLLVAVCALIMAACFVGFLIGSPVPEWLRRSGILLPDAWFALESFRYQALLRRRRRQLGLGSPLAINRILLWGCGFLCQSLLYVLLLVPWATSQPGIHRLLVAILGMGNVACQFLAFYPPHAYVRFIERRAVSATPAVA